MKKFLLFAAAAFVAVGATAAQQKNVLKTFYGEDGGELGGWGGTFEQVEEDGKACVKVTVESELANDWNCQMAFEYDFEPGVTYYIDLEVKGTVEGSIGSSLQNSTTYAGGGNFNPFDITTEWNKQTIECTATEAGDGLPNRWTANFGKYVGSAWVTNVVLYTLEEGDDTPAEPEKEVLVTMYPGDEQFIAWGCDNLLTQDFEIDGRTAAKFDQTAEGKNPWEVQFAYDYDYVPGTKYFFSFEVKGDPTGTITSGFQCTDGWVGCGDVEAFDITADWSKVVISGTPKATDDDKLPNRWVANLGNYVGTFYISNVEIYVEKGASVETIAPAKVVMTGVYNLNGVKIANSIDEVTVPGLYISNGKKVIKK